MLVFERTIRYRREYFEGEFRKVFFFFFFHSFFVVSTPGSRYYADVTGIRIPILSSVSLTSESSASVRSSKGKLQLGDVNPIERTQTNRTRIVIGGVIFGLCGVRHHRDDKRRSLSSSPLFVEEDRPVFVSLYRRIEFGTGQSIESWKTDFSKPFLFFGIVASLSGQLNVNLVDSFGRCG